MAVALLPFVERFRLRKRDGLVLYLLISELDLDVSLNLVFVLVRSSVLECDEFENMPERLAALEKIDDRPVVFELNKDNFDE